MKFFRIYAKVLYALIFVLVVAFAWDVVKFVNSIGSEFGYPLPIATTSTLVLYIALLMWAKKFQGNLVNAKFRMSDVDWNEALFFIQSQMAVKDAKDILNDNVDVSIVESETEGRIFELRWKDYRRSFSVSDFDLNEGYGWKMYLSKNKTIAFMFVFGMSSTSYCFAKDFSEILFKKKPE